MKKLLALLLCLTVFLLFPACKQNDSDRVSTDSTTGSTSETTDPVTTTGDSTSPATSNSQNATTALVKGKTTASAAKTTTTKTLPAKNTTVANATTTTPSNNGGSAGGNAGVTTPDNPLGDLVLGEDYGAFAYDGTFVSLECDQNVVYLLFKSPNMIVAYDAESLDVLYTQPLPGRAREVRVYGDQLWVSFPELQSIKAYAKNSFTLLKSVSLQHPVGSFCVDGDQVYYAEDDQHCNVFRANIVTKTETQVEGIEGRFFYEPKLLLNKERNLLYIGESGSTASTLYYYKTGDLSLHSQYKRDDYGLSNGERTMFLVDDNIFWGGMRFSAADANVIIGEYGGFSTYHADSNFVITRDGIYDTNTYQQLEAITPVAPVVHMAVTANKCLIAVYHPSGSRVVVALPY